MRYTVTGVEHKDRWVSSHGNPMATYAVQLEGVEGWVKLNQLAKTDPPQKGDILEGTLETESFRGNTYQKFKKDYSRGASAEELSILGRIEKNTEEILKRLPSFEDNPFPEA